MINRLTLSLPQDEYSALISVAIDELRTPADQARHMLREELANRKVLKLADREPVENLQKASLKDETRC